MKIKKIIRENNYIENGEIQLSACIILKLIDSIINNTMQDEREIINNTKVDFGVYDTDYKDNTDYSLIAHQYVNKNFYFGGESR